MKQLISFAVCLLLAVSPVQADTEFGDNIPREFVQALLGVTPYGETRIYSDIMDDFPTFDLPDGFTVLGSADRGYGLAVVLATALNEQESRDALSPSFTSRGYTEFNPPNMQISENGFIYPNTSRPSRMERLCHDDEGYVSFSFNAAQDGNVVNISSSPHNRRESCAQQLEEQALMASRASIGRGNLREYLPRMELPESNERRYQPFGFGSSGGSDGVDVRAGINSELEIEELFEHFKSQIEEQGWALDSENVGSSSANGIWARTPEPDMDLIGTLRIIMSDEESYDLNFNLVQVGGSRAGRIGGGVFRSQ